MGGRAARPIRGGDTGPWVLNLWSQGLLGGACRPWAAPCGLQLGSTCSKHKRRGSGLWVQAMARVRLPVRACKHAFPAAGSTE